MRELFVLFPVNSMTEKEFRGNVRELVDSGAIVNSGEYIRRSDAPALEQIRAERAEIADKRIKIALFMSQIIRRFPFVRGIFLSGDLSKGVATPPSDIDYVIVTAPGRLWICRTLLILFKKTFLLNKKKFFCLNYFIAEDSMYLDDQTYFTATEIAHLRPVINYEAYLAYLDANAWIKSFFPNFTP
ncbi:MAG TPA: nucleotidyltransferase domain-containing protein, partial [Bacteroidota bacterium]|nr:nucleotidyltransferase domain-containing protein [Bacteroidota bacterium]